MIEAVEIIATCLAGIIITYAILGVALVAIQATFRVIRCAIAKIKEAAN
jgi:hypothetical protein